MTPVRISVFTSFVMAASIGFAAAAQQTYAAPGTFSAHYGFASGQAYADRLAYDRLGSRGRLDIGANPIHPEGPGNFSD